jgi:hypothetical protein
MFRSIRPAISYRGRDVDLKSKPQAGGPAVDVTVDGPGKSSSTNLEILGSPIEPIRSFRMLTGNQIVGKADGTDVLLGNVESQYRHAAHLNTHANGIAERWVGSCRRLPTGSRPRASGRRKERP